MIQRISTALCMFKTALESSCFPRSGHRHADQLSELCPVPRMRAVALADASSVPARDRDLSIDVATSESSGPVSSIIRSRGSMKHMSIVVQQLKKERVHVQQQLQRIDAALAALGSSSNGMSAAGRRRISLAQKKRWEKARTAKPKLTISVASRKRIAAAQRARWAKAKRAA